MRIDADLIDRRKMSIKPFLIVLATICILIGVAIAIPINNVNVSAIKTNSSLISWDSTTAGTSIIEYGTTASYDSQITENSLAYFHTQTITGLTPSTAYHYRIRTKDIDNTETLSDDYIFTTLSQTELDNKIKAARVDGGLPKTYYVSPTGNDANNGLSPATPFQHPSYAVNKTDVGDTVYLMDGTWNDNSLRITFPKSGIDIAPVRLMAYNGSTLVLQGDRASTYIPGDVVLTINKDYIVVSGITIQNFNLGTGISIRGNNVILTGTNVSGIGYSPGGGDGYGGALGISGSYVAVTNSTFSDSGWNLVGISLQAGKKTTHVSISNSDFSKTLAHNLLDVFNNQYDASLYLEYININNNVFHDQLNSNMFYPHGAIPSNMDYFTVSNNVFRNGNRGMVAEYLRNSLVSDNTFSNFVEYALGAGASTKVQDNVTFRNNVISSSGASYFSIQPGSTINLKSNNFTPVEIDYGTAIVADQLPNSWLARPNSGGTMDIRYTNNQVFKLIAYSNPSYYSLGAITYFSSFSQVIMSATIGNTAQFTITTYPLPPFLPPAISTSQSTR